MIFCFFVILKTFPLRSISPDSGGKCLQSRQKGGRFAASEKVAESTFGTAEVGEVG